MKNLLLDVDIVVDICSMREPYHEPASEALGSCFEKGISPWVYVGSVQALEFSLASELIKQNLSDDEDNNLALSLQKAKELLKRFSKEINWLAALAGEGDVFSAKNSGSEQLIRSLDRFPEASARLLTRDRDLLEHYPDQTISVEDFCRIMRDVDLSKAPLDFVDLKTQQHQIRPSIERHIHTVLHHGRYVMGPEIQDLEKLLADYASVNHCVAVSSGTDALLMPLMALGIGPGDAVFTTPFTFIATAEVIAFLGAVPVFVDIDPRTFNIDPKKLELAIDAVKANDASIYPLPQYKDPLSPKAVIPVDLFGLPADYEAIMEITERENLFLLDDCAQGFGSVYKGRHSVSMVDAGATSFFPAKPLGSYGEGGAIFTNDSQLNEELGSIRIHGQGKNRYDNVRIGLNARMHTMQAAVLLTKFKIFQKELIERERVASLYTEGLNNKECFSSITTPYVPEGLKSAWAQYSILTEGPRQRERIRATLQETGIPTMIYYPFPLHTQEAFSELGYKADDFPISMQISNRILSLPMHPNIKSQQVAKTINAIEKAV